MKIQIPNNNLLKNLALALLCALALDGQLLMAQGNKLKIDKNGLEYTVNLDSSLILGQDVMAIINLKAKNAQEVYSLDDASIKLIIVPVVPKGEKRQPYEVVIGGEIRAVKTELPGGDLVDYEKVEQKRILLKAGDKIEKRINLSEVFGRHFDPGKYKFYASYEGVVESNSYFKVKTYYKESIPLLIGLMEKGKPETKVWARNSMYIITGQPEWIPNQKDDAAKTASEIKKIRDWWEKNKDLIIRINNVLDPEMESKGF